jgi:F5/8 type C domain
MRRLSSPVVVASAVYVLLTVALTWPLVLHPGSRVPNDLGDSLLNMWLLDWNARVLPLTARWWNAPQFFPVPGVTAFSEHLLGLSIITTPIIVATGNTLLAYNAAFFLSFPLCALSAYFLTHAIARRHDAALVAGLAFGFSPYRMAQFAHIQVLSAYWMPVALGALHLYLRDRRRRWLVLFAVSWAMQALACGYYLFYLSALVALWLVWFGFGRWRDLFAIVCAWAVAAVALVPVAYGYWKFQHAYGFRRGIDEIRSFSADLASLLSAPSNLRLWGWLNVVDRPESALFPGFVILVLIVAALVLTSASAAPRPGRVRAAWWALGGAMVFGVAALTPALVGPWKFEVAGVRLLSIASANKPLSVCVLLLTAAALMHPAFRAAWQRRSPLAFYLPAAAAMWVFSLGPDPTLMNKPLLYKAPYAWLMMLPGADGVRVPARFWLLATLCLAVTAGLAVCRLAIRWPRAGRTLAAAAGAAILIDTWPQAMALEMPPAPRPNHTDAVARLDLPLDPGHDLLALHDATSHHRPVFNGYSGYFAPHYFVLQDLLTRHDPAVLTRLAEIGPIEVVIDHAEDPQKAWRQFVSSHPQARQIHNEAGYSSYRIEASPRRPPATLTSPPLTFAAIAATTHPELVGAMTDGNLITRWHAGRAQEPGDSFTVDLGATRQVDGVELTIGGYAADYPRELRIETSEDGQSWTEAWRGSGGPATLSAAFDKPAIIPLVFPLDPRPARYVRLTELAREVIYYWTVAELRITGR